MIDEAERRGWDVSFADGCGLRLSHEGWTVEPFLIEITDKESAPTYKLVKEPGPDRTMSGRLVLASGHGVYSLERSVGRDGRRGSLEQQLGRIFVGYEEGSQAVARAVEERRQRERAERERRHAEHLEQARREWAALIVERHQKARALRDFIGAVSESDHDIPDEDLDWLRQWADQLDPAEPPIPIVDRKRISDLRAFESLIRRP